MTLTTTFVVIITSSPSVDAKDGSFQDWVDTSCPIVQTLQPVNEYFSDNDLPPSGRGDNRTSFRSTNSDHNHSYRPDENARGSTRSLSPILCEDSTIAFGSHIGDPGGCESRVFGRTETEAGEATDGKEGGGWKEELRLELKGDGDGEDDCEEKSGSSDDGLGEDRSVENITDALECLCNVCHTAPRQ